MTSRDVPHIICPRCGAENNAFGYNCWMCHAALVEDDQLVEAVAIGPPPYVQRANRLLLSFIYFLLAIVLVVVALGIGALEPGMLIGYLIFVCPAMLGISILLSKGLKSSNKTLSTITSVVACLFLSVLLLIAVIVGLFVLCLAILVPASFH